MRERSYCLSEAFIFDGLQTAYPCLGKVRPCLGGSEATYRDSSLGVLFLVRNLNHIFARESRACTDVSTIVLPVSVGLVPMSFIRISTDNRMGLVMGMRSCTFLGSQPQSVVWCLFQMHARTLVFLFVSYGTVILRRRSRSHANIVFKHAHPLARLCVLVCTSEAPVSF